MDARGQSDEISAVTAEVAEAYASDIVKRLPVYGYDEIDTRLHIFGGGGCLLRNYSGLREQGNVTFYDDICANAKGYEIFAQKKMESGGKG